MVTGEMDLEQIEQKKREVADSVTGETIIDDEVIASIAGITAKEIEGVANLGTSSIRRTLSERVGGAETRARGVAIQAGRKEAIVNLTLNVVYGFSMPTMVSQIRRAVASRLLELTGLVTKEVNIHIVGLEFPERMASRVA